MTHKREPQKRITIAITGSGGAGVMTAGSMLLEAAAKGGWYVLQTRAVGPQIRGGEAAALLRLSTTPVEIHDGPFDLVFAVDWMNFDRFSAEIKLTKETIILCDPEAGDPPLSVIESGATVCAIPLKGIAAQVEGARPNMIALGVLAGAIEMPVKVVNDIIVDKLQSKGDRAVATSIAAVEAGYTAAATLVNTPKLAPAVANPDDHWIITGNEAAALGAVRGGIRFAAAYPITPATEILEWLSSALPKVGGKLVQAEDELASINMAIGASYGGVPSITATSGPGYALMTEAIGLAAAAEIPVVIVDVMRGGPSTGIPTKSEQSDLNIAVYGLHGDAPHIVLGPNSISDCIFTTQWAAHLADELQVPAVVLSDQLLGQTSLVIDRPANVSFLARRHVAEQPGEAYKRYAVTESGVSPMAIPGISGGQY
ncbi:MAG: 2-oxoacid:acceptor oxidoreductase family protein, partial [Fimbriimonadaceae bacterium]|nr:2-oxoacid:acceptor oxidoreductase family protein [Alphaproteobacteria bacterium]